MHDTFSHALNNEINTNLLVRLIVFDVCLGECVLERCVCLDWF